MNRKLLILVSSLAIVLIIGVTLGVNSHTNNLKLSGSDNTENMEVTTSIEGVKFENVSNVLYGDEAVDTLEVLQLNDQYLAEDDGTYVFFLKKDSKSDHYIVLGGLQGVMEVENGTVYVSPTIEHNMTTTLESGLVPLTSLINYLN